MAINIMDRVRQSQAAPTEATAAPAGGVEALQAGSQRLQEIAASNETSPAQTVSEVNDLARIVDSQGQIIVSIMLEMAKRISALEGRR